MASTRFPGKPLIAIMGRPMLWHIWKRCQMSGVMDTVAIATCDDEIRWAAESFGAQVIMTAPTHTRATDRVAEAAGHLPGDVILNVQGDEPLVNPQLLRDIVVAYARDPQCNCLNPVAPIEDAEDLTSPNTVKATLDRHGRILYFSRYPIPSDAMGPRRGPVYRQVPIIAFGRRFLEQFLALPETPLEIQESVDLLRPIEHGLAVHGLVTTFQTIGVDGPDDVARVERFLADDPVYRQYAEEGV
jgi:3-deoxy-manno-octulosonate cytidylyltransferase (CMP-KDO synthetase)